MGKGLKKPLKNGDEVMLLNPRPDQVTDAGIRMELNNRLVEAIGFIFTVSEDEVMKAVKRGADSLAADKAESEKKRAKLDEEYSQEMQCGICIDLMYQAVTAMPCLHSVNSLYI